MRWKDISVRAASDSSSKLVVSSAKTQKELREMEQTGESLELLRKKGKQFASSYREASIAQAEDGIPIGHQLPLESWAAIEAARSFYKKEQERITEEGLNVVGNYCVRTFDGRRTPSHLLRICCCC